MKEHNWIKIALTPFSWVYGLITNLRNLGYDHQLFASKKASQFVISIGNLTVGGTGKTPVTEYLTSLFSGNAPTAILSRGYGRQTRGFIEAGSASTPAEIGDEPMQYFLKFNPDVLVAVCENRFVGAENIALSAPERKLLLLDDAFQHRAIARDVNLLLNDFQRPFYQDLPFPAGRLRETRNGAKRADAIIVTKAPLTLAGHLREDITRAIRQFSKPETPIFFSSLEYGAPKSYAGGDISLKKVKMAAGIANPLPFAAYLRARFDVTDEVVFRDHHNYTPADVEELIKNLKNDTFVVTTEKDMVKLKPLVEASGAAGKFAYIPVKVSFGSDTGRFHEWIFKQTGHLFQAER
ncbi:tetraacyldisaccharide 4'-kinase [Dyadobacter psychrophilus]|uniref:Tetraacyldisaccharide 4'-kinase n=1 Tax=Dyadobacter psychrophilus TaxID=651661 RepID=A0A1T5B9A4_9BACT|nr:tetraacyldisaccharide 4'-kinase [Dyadobacter psychrophilus]SKB43735.1 lipid-A-disaccharide kinase [Dyadobacter psychrophilus]